jgi:protein-tyrosine phosphatase
MAEGLFRHALPSLTVASAGLHAAVGMASDPRAVAAMRRRGIDIAGHRSRPLTRQLCAESDLLLVMDQGLRSAILQRYPETAGRVHTLARHPIADPRGQPDTAFEACHRNIALAVHAWNARLRRLAGPAARTAP